MTAQLHLKSATYRVGDEDFAADVGDLTVPEDRTPPNSHYSRTITLPVVRLRSPAAEAAGTVFLLAGGPGYTNIWEKPKTWLLGRHDVVMIGYRGADGSVSLDLPEVAAAMAAAENPLSVENRRRIGRAWRAGYERLTREGVAAGAYTMLDVADDLEDARRALACGPVDLYATSYGTRLAYYYGLRYPQSVRRSVMVGVNPPGRFIWEAGTIDRQLEYYGELWRRDEAAASRTPDIVATMRDVLAGLPAEWGGIRLDRDKVRIWTFAMLSQRRGAASALNAYAAAARGNMAGLAFLSQAYDAFVTAGPNFGDMAAKAVGADFDPDRDYEAELDPAGSVLGSPLSMLYWATMKYGGWPFRPLPDEYRAGRPSAVETLLISGTVDFATPGEYAAAEMLPLLPNGRAVTCAEFGHCSDLSGIQPAAHRHLVETFYADGTADDSLFRYEPMDFSPEGG